MIPILIILGFNILLYFPTIFFGLVMDDCQQYDRIKKDGFTKVPWTLRYIPNMISDRLYSGCTFGFNTKVDHAFTLALWCTFCTLSYFALGHNNVSLGATLLISCHPMMNEVSIWINGRRYLICAILLMACMITWPFSLPFYLLSSLFQVSILFAPILFVNKYPIAILPIAALGFIMKDWILNKIATRSALIFGEDLKVWKPRRPILIIKIYGFYFWKMILPGRVQMVYPFLQMFGRTKEGNEHGYEVFKSNTGINGDLFKGVFAILVTCAICWFAGPMYWPWAAFMAISLLQWCAIIPVTQLVADRYTTIPTIFLMFFISYFSLHFNFGWAIIAFLMGNYIHSTRQVFSMYKDLNSWYEYHVSNDPGNLSVVNLRAGYMLSAKKFWQANSIIERGLERWPNDYALNYLGYISSMIVQSPPLARKYIEVCKKNIYLGEEKERQGELDDADIALRALMGEINLKIPERMIRKG